MPAPAVQIRHSSRSAILFLVFLTGQALQLVALESYRDLVKLLQKGLDDAQGIRAALQENIELRAQAKSAAAAAAGVPVSNSRPAPSIPSGDRLSVDCGKRLL